jgi:hypothetical protein
MMTQRTEGDAGLRVPDAVQRGTKWSGALLIRDRHATGRSRSGAVPGLQRIIPLRFMLRCARDTYSHGAP